VTETKLNVPDMSCAHCKAAVEDSLNALDGVASSHADFEKGIVEIIHDEKQAGPEELERAIQSAGYTVAS
jgi:copper chaperone CopZ